MHPQRSDWLLAAALAAALLLQLGLHDTEGSAALNVAGGLLLTLPLGGETARVRVEVRPALRMENLFETAVELAEDGRTNRKGMPKPLDLALFVREFSDEVQGAFPPVWVQRLTLAPVAWLARKRGLAARYTPRPAVA